MTTMAAHGTQNDCQYGYEENGRCFGCGRFREEIGGPAHDTAGGTLCTFGDNGTCEVCGVGEDECPMCNGIGYHNGLCPESEANYDDGDN